MTVIVSEDRDQDGNVTWGVSFTSHNPEPEHYVAMKSKEDAFRLKRIIEHDLCIAFKPSLPFPLNQVE